MPLKMLPLGGRGEALRNEILQGELRSGYKPASRGSHSQLKRKPEETIWNKKYDWIENCITQVHYTNTDTTVLYMG